MNAELVVHDMFNHDMFTICSFNSPDLDGYQGSSPL
jgi:hypothetical protein